MEEIKLINTDGTEVTARFKMLDLDYIDKIIELEGEVINKLADKDLYAITTREEYIECITCGGYILGCVTLDDELVAIGVYVKYGYSEHNYGYDLDISGDELLYVGQIQSTAVKEEYRGNGLQRIICNNLENIARKEDTKVLGATVSPKNLYSLNNFKRMGYTVQKEKIKYGNYLRYILKKEL